MSYFNSNFIENLKNSKPVEWLKNFFNNLTPRTITNIIFVAIPLILLYIYVDRNSAEIKQTAKVNQKIETKVDSLKVDNQFIVQRMYELEKNQIMFFDMINQNNLLIKENNKELLNLKRIYNEKISSINSFNITQLDSFFTSRYKEYYNK